MREKQAKILKRSFWVSVVVAGLVALSTFGAALAAEPGKGNRPPGFLGSPWLGPDGSALPFQTDQEILDFLLTAQPLSSKRVGEGINQTQKVLLEKDGLRMNAAFRRVSSEQQIPNPANPAILVKHRDDCIFELAAYRLSRMLGLSLVPPTVVRKLEGKTGTLQAWVEKAMMEKQRRKKGIQPPDEWYWMSQMLTMHLFDNLVANTDRHQGNLLIDLRWEIWLIDHTQAFRRYKALHSPEQVLYCDREVWKRLRSLDKETIQAEFKDLLRPPEIRALLKRRNLLLAQISKLIDQRGEDKVLF